MTKPRDQRPKSKFIWLFFALATIALYFFALGVPLLGPDEPRYAQVAREMHERNDWITPTLGGFNWFEKPALLYWLQITGYKLFGLSEFAARAGSAVFGLLTILSLWILGRSLTANVSEEDRENQRPEKDFANWLFLISASSLGLLVFSRGASFDIILTFPITASLVGFFIFDQSDKENPITYHLSLITFYFFIGLALLAKGLIGIVFPLAIVGFYYLLLRKLPSKTFVFSLFWGVGLSVLVASAWYLPMYLQHGWTFIDEFFLQHHFARYVSNKYQHRQPFWFFWVVLPLMTAPWLPFFFASIWNFISRKDNRAQSELPIATYKLRIFALAWLLVPLVFFSLSGSKLPGYILPALPAAVILTAEYVWRFTRKSKNRELALQSLAFLMFVVIVVILQFFLDVYARRDSVKDLIATANEQGFTGEKILNFRDVSHNAEFYGAGRLIRLADGRQKTFTTDAEVAEEIKGGEKKSVLILTPLQDSRQLTESALIQAKVLGDNGELAIVLADSQESKTDDDNKNFF